MCPTVFLRGGDHLLLAGMTLMLWRGLLWQQGLRWWRRAHLFSLVWKVRMCGHSWAYEGVRESEKCTFMLTLKEAGLADGLVICALPCQRKDTFGLHLSGRRPYKACHTEKTGKKRERAAPECQDFYIFWCLPVQTPLFSGWLLTSTSQNNSPVKYTVKTTARNSLKKYSGNVSGMGLLITKLLELPKSAFTLKCTFNHMIIPVVK